MEITSEVKAAVEQMRTTIAESWKQQIALTDTERIAEFKKNLADNLTNQIAEIYKDRSEKLPFEVVVENDGADKYGRFNVSIKTEDPFLKSILENLPENPGPSQHDLDLITTCLGWRYSGRPICDDLKGLIAHDVHLFLQWYYPGFTYKSIRVEAKTPVLGYDLHAVLEF